MEVNMKKKVLLIVSLFAILTISVCVSVSFLSDKDATKNTFTIGEVSILLDETAVDKNGKPIKEAERVVENKYHLLPGKSYVKDPTVTVVAGSDESFVRILVTLTKYKELKKLFGENFEPGDFVTGYNPEKWIYVDKTIGNNNDVTYEFRYYTIVDGYNDKKEEKLVLEPLFQTIEIPGEVDATDLEIISDLEINIVAHAIQASSFDGYADLAWAAFTKQYNE
jgi:hypothetical protein